MDWINLAQDLYKWWALVDTVMNLWFSQNFGDCLSGEVLASQERIRVMESVT
jgi:hypothetical protein